MKTDKKEFIEPILIKAGSDLLRLGQMKTKPRCDCRVISEDNYQLLKEAYDNTQKEHEKLKDEVIKAFNEGTFYGMTHDRGEFDKEITGNEYYINEVKPKYEK